MGRHRRSAAGRAATGRATGVGHAQRSGSGSEDPWLSSAGGRQIPTGIAPYLNPEAYAEATAKAQAYLFATEDGPASSSGSGSGGPSSGRRRRGGSGRPVRAGLLGVSAAVALGTAAVAAGVVPGLGHYQLGGGSRTTGGEQVQAPRTPGNTASEQGGTSGSADSPATTPAGGDAGHRTSPSPSASASPSVSPSASASASPSTAPSPSASKSAPAPAPKRPSATATPSKRAAGKPAPKKTPARRATPAAPATPAASAEPRSTPSRTPTKAPAPASTPVTVSREAAVAAEVLKLVNEERAKAGRSPLAANSSLTRLAESFSDDMAARGFFDHTDPDGRTPWDRAASAGITELGGENIARGQADAAAVMQSWMNSPGHRANILNPDFKTLGVGVHFGPGGPWWTQDFGY
ncbi:CAP domain-containing protein [Streptomyces sp. NRRL B-3648]|uniref:CAP domain-containing protein n=1 Tax=Streptomyces sp. NRRL B-3648 TaxID=1519493 RepID=UPI0006AF186C|nr:CAP domain-containing protein [Streptomyces sp. NRRL B-3648]KOX05981.1 membrane protein [Streptomyces sp. NRRL B-3648]